ncbi:hypothetical protein ACP6C3_30810 [Mycolicibacterium septicum]|uniref:Uncharacterized protein n=1 Tax=Mycolicibacterium septicum TaxID=98668 RepID=A0ABW9M4Y2_9MYCO
MTEPVFLLLVTFTALAVIGSALIIGSVHVYRRAWPKRGRQAWAPAAAVGVAAGLWAKLIIDAAPWVLEDLGTADSAYHPTKVMTGGLDYYIASLKWALVAVTLCLFAAAAAGAFIGLHRGLEALHVWLSGYQTQHDEEVKLTRAARMRMTWRVGRAEERFARTLVKLVGPASRKRRGAVLWKTLPEQPGTDVRATSFSVSPGLAYYSISDEAVEAFTDNALLRSEIQHVDYLATEDDSEFIVQWNCDFLARPFVPAKDTSTGILSFGLQPRERLRRSAGAVALVVVLAVAVAAAWGLTVDTGASTAAHTVTAAAPQAITDAKVVPGAGRPHSRVLRPASTSGEACSLRRDHPATAHDPCDHAGRDGSRYVFDFDDVKAVTAVIVNPAALQSGRVVREVIWRFNGDPEHGYPASEQIQLVEPVAGRVLLLLNRPAGLRASRVTAIISDTRPGADGDQRGREIGDTPFEVVGHEVDSLDAVESVGPEPVGRQAAPR